MFSRGQADHIFAVLLLLTAAKSPENDSQKQRDRTREHADI